MSRRFSRFIAVAVVAASGLSLLTTAFDAEARRAGGGFSMGRQSSNVMQQRRAVTPPAATTGAATAQRSAAAATGAAAAGTAAARSGMSKWLGPLAGIAAGLGIAALLSHLGLSGAFLEMLSSMVLIGLVVFAVLYIVRRLRGGAARPAMQGAGASSASPSSPQMWRESLKPTVSAQPAAAPVSALAEPVREGDWTIPAGFDSAAFLGEAKKQFVQIQKIWDGGDLALLRDYLTDDLIAEMQHQLSQRTDTDRTEVVLLNAELLGIEKVSDGHLASVRFSGMLREGAGEAFRFEEVWNLLKPASGGWLLAGIQQIPVEHAS